MIDRQAIIDNIKRVQDTCAKSASKAGRDVREIHIMAVTKTFGYEVVEPALAAGITLFGENKVQEAVDKYPASDKRAYELHMIGHLQSNKTKKAMDFFQMIQSVDSFKLARELNKHARERGIVYPVLIEVNVGNEESKSGFDLSSAASIPEEFASLASLRVEGIMAIPPFLNDPNATRPYFIQLRKLYETLAGDPVFRSTFRFLSMGMSHDYPVAIEEGANLIRLGTALFGTRS